MQYDFLIIGQGLAGTNLAHHLIKSGLSFQVVDNNRTGTASKVAAGLFNPITGRKFVKTWKADDLFPYLNNFYADIEDVLNTHFYHPIGVYRPFLNTEEQNDWVAKSGENSYKSFIEKAFTESRGIEGVLDPFGGILLSYSGYVDTEKYLSASRSFFKKNELILEEDFSPDVFETFIEDTSLVYGGNSFEKVVLCDGNGNLSKKYFDFLPFQPVKGEILELDSAHELDFVLNRGVWIVPVEARRLKVGSTYSWELEKDITSKAKEEILEKYKKLHISEFKVIKQSAGIRPATRDRRPFMGVHPKNSRLYIFNGMGSKGTSLTPYFSSEMVAFLLGEKDLSPEVDIRRYFI